MASTISAGTTAGTAIAIAGDTTGNLAFQTNGTTTAMTIDTSQNVGIGTASPAAPLDVVGNSSAIAVSMRGRASDSACVLRWMSNDGSTVNGRLQVNSGGDMIFQNTNSITERMRITSDGYVGIGTSSPDQRLVVSGNTTSAIQRIFNLNGVNTYQMSFHNSVGEVGTISTGSGSTSYNTSSDYRLKENIEPMTNALAKVAQLKPCTYTWKSDGSAGQGFIAHELQAVVPQCVTGEKDAVETYTDDEGNKQTRIKPQGVDTSFLVATLTAAIQELKAELDATKAEVAALKGA